MCQVRKLQEEYANTHYESERLSDFPEQHDDEVHQVLDHLPCTAEPILL
jgi:hypothetical protein